MTPEHTSLAEQLQRDSHRICSLILNSDLEWIDIAIEIGQMRQICEAAAPDKLELFEAIYVSRFNRLWQQWRPPAADPGLFDFFDPGRQNPFDADREDPEGWGLTPA